MSKELLEQNIQQLNHTHIVSQRGFTLIELLVSITLGVLISAAIIQVFVTSQRVDSVQRSGSEIQSSSIFGLQSMERQIRMANLGNDGSTMSDTTPNGGIVLSTNNVASLTTLDAGYLTIGGTMTATGNPDRWQGTNTNLSIPSDQLTIQYKNNVTTKIGVELFDCTGATVADKDIVIQRYYLAAVPPTPPATTSTNRYNLMCEAGRIVETPAAIATDPPTYTMTNFGNASPKTAPVVVMDNVDQFNIRLGLSKKAKTNPEDMKETITHYDLSINEYMALTTAKPDITSIKMAVVVRGSTNSPEDGRSSFIIFGNSQTLKTAAQTNVIRRVFETSVLLRNGRVMLTL